MTFAMVLKRRPVSLRAGGRSDYVSEVRERARLAAPPRPFAHERIYVRIVWFHQVPTQGDLDNIVKPILDALEHVVYENDRLVCECLAVRVDASSTYEMSDSPVRDDAYASLVDALDQESGHVVYIEVGEAGPQRVRFGPIER